MLQELHSVRYLTLNLDIVACLSSCPDLLSHRPSPFSNLICVNIDSSREDQYKVKISAETRNFFLENSPNATFITDLPEEPPTKAIKAKLATEKKRARLVSNIEWHMKVLQASLKQENRLFRKQAMDKTKAVLENLIPELQQALTMKKLIHSDPGQAKESVEIEREVFRMKDQMLACAKELLHLNQLELNDVTPINSKKVQVRSWLEALPKWQRAEMEARYSHQFEEIETMINRSSSSYKEASSYLNKVKDLFGENVSSSNLPLASSS